MTQGPVDIFFEWLGLRPADARVAVAVDVDDAMIKRAQRFLIDTQRDDGSWAVQGTKANKKDRIEETAVYWGTTWAVIGLVESLPN